MVLAQKGFLGGSVVKNPPAKVGDAGSVPELGRSSGEGSSAGISSPPLALFIVILPQAHLTLHSRMSGSR